MHNIVNNITTITKELSAINSNTKIIAVSKTFTMSYIKPLVDYGHIDFGENKVQEAISKWTEIKEKNQNIKLHLIGKLQTNKVKFCLPLFDYIHSLDSIKLADKIANEQMKKNFKPKIFIQVNVGDEDQKSGVTVKDFESFYKKITEDFDFNKMNKIFIYFLKRSLNFCSVFLLDTNKLFLSVSISNITATDSLRINFDIS